VCQFPFIFEGRTYSKCTTVKSENNKPWCATQVDSDGQVVRGKWEDCEENCDEFCDDSFLFNVEGRCVKNATANGFLRLLKENQVPAELDEDFSGSQKATPRCPSARSPSDLPDFCRCEKGPVKKDLAGNIKGGCVPPLGGDSGFPDADHGYCFLENILDPAEPTSSCFSDTEWSASDARFYSFLACAKE